MARFQHTQCQRAALIIDQRHVQLPCKDKIEILWPFTLLDKNLPVTKAPHLSVAKHMVYCGIRGTFERTRFPDPVAQLVVGKTAF